MMDRTFIDNIDLVVFAGGIGRRMSSLTAETNKVLLPYRNEPIIDQALRPFLDLGFRHLTFLTSCFAEQVEDHVRGTIGDDVNVKFIRGDINLNSRVKQVVARNGKGFVTLHGNIILNKESILEFLGRLSNYTGDFLALSSGNEENFASGHPFTFTSREMRLCSLGKPETSLDELRCLVGLNYMSVNAVGEIDGLEQSRVPEDLLIEQLVEFEEVITNHKVKHFENEQDMINDDEM